MEAKQVEHQPFSPFNKRLLILIALLLGVIAFAYYFYGVQFVEDVAEPLKDEVPTRSVTELRRDLPVEFIGPGTTTEATVTNEDEAVLVRQEVSIEDEGSVDTGTMLDSRDVVPITTDSEDLPPTSETQTDREQIAVESSGSAIQVGTVSRVERDMAERQPVNLRADVVGVDAAQGFILVSDRNDLWRLQVDDSTTITMLGQAISASDLAVDDIVEVSGLAYSDEREVFVQSVVVIGVRQDLFIGDES